MKKHIHFLSGLLVFFLLTMVLSGCSVIRNVMTTAADTSPVPSNEASVPYSDETLNPKEPEET